MEGNRIAMRRAAVRSRGHRSGPMLLRDSVTAILGAGAALLPYYLTPLSPPRGRGSGVGGEDCSFSVPAARGFSSGPLSSALAI